MAVSARGQRSAAAFALITGCSSGFGLATALDLASARRHRVRPDAELAKAKPLRDRVLALGLRT